MSVRNVVVIGASAGGVPALNQVLGGLPPDYAASVLVVMHTPPFAESRLPEVLSRAGPLPGKHADDGDATVFTCPDCGGVLWQDGTNTRVGFRCHVGHTYGPELLLGQKSEELEAALWTSVRLLRERATLSRQLATNQASANHVVVRSRLDDQGSIDERHEAVIRELLEAFPNSDDIMSTPRSRDDSGAPSD